MSNLNDWMEAVITVAGSNGMSDEQVIDTWPKDVADQFPPLTVGMVRDLSKQLNTDAPAGHLEVMGNIRIDEGDELQPYDKALVITFDSAEDIRAAIAAGKCTFSFKE